MRELAERLRPPVSLQAISKYETGRMMPSAPVLCGLAGLLDVRTEFLLGGPVASLKPEDAVPRPPASMREVAEFEFLMLAGIEERLSLAPLPSQDPFGHLQGPVVRGPAEIEALARRLRDRWSVGSGPLPSVRDLLELQGIPVVEGDVPERFSGLLYRVSLMESGSDARAIFLSGRSCLERKRLVLASALGRCMICEASARGIAGSGAWQRFGGAFLVPADSLRREAGRRRKRVALREILDLKSYFGIPAVALVKRLRETGILPRRECERILRGNGRSWRRAEPEPTLSGAEDMLARARLARLVWRALSEERISLDRAAQILDRPVRDLQQGLRPGVSRNPAVDNYPRSSVSN